MSYDIDLIINTGKGRMVSAVYIGNFTYNAQPHFEAASGPEYFEIKSPRDLNGMRAADALLHLERIVFNTENDPKIKQIPFANNWGDFDSWLRFLQDWRDLCRDHPATIVSVN